MGVVWVTSGVGVAVGGVGIGAVAVVGGAVLVVALVPTFVQAVVGRTCE